MTDQATTAPKGQTITKSEGPYGWTCPVCKRGLAPWVRECDHGDIPPITTWSTESNPMNEHIVYTTSTEVKDD